MRTLFVALMLGCCIAQAAEPPVDLEALKGSYTLADGRKMYVTQRQHKLYVQIGDETPVELKPAGGSAWRTEAGTLRVDFTQYANGLVSAVQLDRTPPASQLASRQR